MKNYGTILSILLLLSLGACTDSKPGASSGDKQGAKGSVALTTDPVPARIDSLKRLARPGDLLFRLGDDMMSYSIRYLSERDPSYSHVGVLMERNGVLQVAHIGPYEGGRDTLHSEPIDSFINPAKNLDAGLYRFRINETERAHFLSNVAAWGKKDIHFDYWYNLDTDDKLYCSELIAKSMAPATNNRIAFPGKLLPERMLKLMYAYFASLSTDTTLIRQRRYISLDQLYGTGHCDSLLKISLRPPL